MQTWDQRHRTEIAEKDKKIEGLEQELMISNRESYIKDNHIMLPFKPKEAETDYLYEEGPDPVDGKLQAITSKQRREAFDKFVIDWRKQNSLDGTDVMPPTEVIPLWMRRAEGLNQDLKIANHRDLTNYLDNQGRSSRTGSFKDSGLNQEKLIEALKIGVQLMKAQGGNPFSTDALDKQKQIKDYLNNDQKLRELLIRQGKMKA